MCHCISVIIYSPRRMLTACARGPFPLCAFECVRDTFCVTPPHFWRDCASGLLYTLPLRFMSSRYCCILTRQRGTNLTRSRKASGCFPPVSFKRAHTHAHPNHTHTHTPRCSGEMIVRVRWRAAISVVGRLYIPGWW